MKGDYYRYMCEYKNIEERKKFVELAHDAYKDGIKICNVDLKPTHPTRLGFILNYAVF